MADVTDIEKYKKSKTPEKEPKEIFQCSMCGNLTWLIGRDTFICPVCNTELDINSVFEEIDNDE